MFEFARWLINVKWAIYGFSFSEVTDVYARMDDETKTRLMDEFKKYKRDNKEELENERSSRKMPALWE